MSIHGFHFELKAVGGRDGIYSFYLQVWTYDGCMEKKWLMSCMSRAGAGIEKGVTMPQLIIAKSGQYLPAC